MVFLDPENLAVDLQVVSCHPLRSEAFLGFFSAGVSCQRRDPVDGLDGFLEIGDEKASPAVLDDLRHGTPIEGDHRCTACHGLDDAEPEGLVEMDQMHSHR